MIYTHASGIDQPLEVVRPDVDGRFVVVPHTDWQGHYDVVTYTGSAYGECGIQFGYGLGSGGICFPFELPAQSAYGDVFPRKPTYEDPGIRSWTGSLMQGSRDASGLLYRRNRYLDPKSGRFTQEDPIGLAGGLNLYGYAGGDPVNYHDPFGLKFVFRTSAADERRYRLMIGWMRERSSSFRRIYDTLDQSSRVTIYVNNLRCPGGDECVGGGFGRRIGIRSYLMSAAEAREQHGITLGSDDWFMSEALTFMHAIIHAAGKAAAKGVNAGVEAECGLPDDASSCVNYYEDVIRSQLGQPRKNASGAVEWGNQNRNPIPEE